MSLKKEIVKANLIFTSGRLISVVIGFFFSIILARMLQPYNFGLYSFSLFVANFFIVFSDFGLASISTRFVSNYLGKKKYGKIKELVGLVLKYKIIFVFTTGLLISLLSNQISTFIFNKPEAGFVVFLSGFVLISVSLFDFFRSLFLGLKNFTAVSSLNILENAFKFVIIIGLVLLGMAVTGAILGLIITYLGLVLISLIIIYKKYDFIISAKKSKVNKRILLTFGSWVFITSIAATIYTLVDQFMISMMLPVEDIGFYRIALAWTWMIIYLVPIAAQVLYPYFSGTENKRQLKSIFGESLRYSSMFIFPLAFLLSAFSQNLILFFYEEAFLPAAYPLSVTAFTSILMVFSMVLSSYFNGIKRPDIFTKVVLAMILLNVIMNYFLIQSLGMFGAALATFSVKLIQILILFSIIILSEKIRVKFSVIMKPLISSVIMYYIASLFLPYVTDYVTLFVFGILSLLIYFGIMFLTGGIKREDLLFIKKGFRS